MVRGGHGVMESMLGSWRRMAVTATLLVVLFVVTIAGASILGPLRRTSLPGHSYPPAGYVQNPFSKDPDDLLSLADVARVKADVLADGDFEVRAFAEGDQSMLARADTGNRLARLHAILDVNNAIGIVQQEQDNRSSIVVGRHPDPRAPSVMWCVQESGDSTLVDIAKADGRELRTQRYRFEGKFWLTRVGDRYLITDAEVTNQTLTTGE